MMTGIVLFAAAVVFTVHANRMYSLKCGKDVKCAPGFRCNDGDCEPVKCPTNAEYRECSNICPINCYTFDKHLCFSLRCGGPKCVCKEGYVQLSAHIERCVPMEICMKMRALREKIDKDRRVG